MAQFGATSDFLTLTLNPQFRLNAKYVPRTEEASCPDGDPVAAASRYFLFLSGCGKILCRNRRCQVIAARITVAVMQLIFIRFRQERCVSDVRCICFCCLLFLEKSLNRSAADSGSFQFRFGLHHETSTA